jgi:predicted nucleic acid-binding protein
MWNGDYMAMTDRHTRSVVCDAGPLIHLDELDCPWLLADFAKILVPATVAGELVQHRPNLLTRTDLPWQHCVASSTRDPRLAALCRLFSLHAGEQDALAQLEISPQHIFLTDDSAARQVAERMGFKVHGSIGVITRAIRRKQMTPSEVIQILSQIPVRSSLYIKPALLQEVIARIMAEFSCG